MFIFKFVVLTLETDRKVLWTQVCGLAAVQGAIALLWVIYNLYLVSLLESLGFSATLATILLIVENLLAMVMEPLMGSLSDRFQQQMGTRFPLVSLGVILTASLFIGIPAIALVGLAVAWRWVFLLVVITWALAMTLFRSPAMSLLGRYAFNTQLPQAASILTLVGGVAGAMGPLAGGVILGWGPLVAFAIGSAVLLLAAFALQLAKPNEAITDEIEPVVVISAEPSSISWRCLGLVFGAGVGVTFGFRTLITLFKNVVDGQITNANAGLILGCIFVSLALTAIPAGVLATRLGNRRAMVMGLAGLTLVCVLVSAVQTSSLAIALALLFGATFSLVSNGTIPFALSMVPTPKAGLGTGIFFSGGAAASSLFSGMVEKLQVLPLGMVAIVGVVGFLLAGICISSAPRHVTIAAS